MSRKPVKPATAFERMLFIEFASLQAPKVLIGAIHITREYRVQWGGSRGVAVVPGVTVVPGGAERAGVVPVPAWSGVTAEGVRPTREVSDFGNGSDFALLYFFHEGA